MGLAKPDFGLGSSTPVTPAVPGVTNTAGAFSARPATSPVAGDIYYHTDGPYFSRWTGSAWNVFRTSDLCGGILTFPPTLTLVGPVGFAQTTTRGPLAISMPNSAPDIGYVYEPYPAVAFTRIIHYTFNARYDVSSTYCGLMFTDNARIVTFGPIRGGAADQGLGVQWWNAVVGPTLNSNRYVGTAGTGIEAGKEGWLRISDDLVNITYSFSHNGGRDSSWIIVATEGSHAFIAAQTRLGLGMLCQSATVFTAVLTVDHYAATV
mgnify:CR=1 FL=1